MVKVSIPNRFQFRMMPEIRGFIFPKRGGEIHYIGGAEILPAPLTIEEEEQVMKKLGGDEDKEARSNLIEHNLRLVVYIAKKFDNTGVGVEDLISIGTIGLIKAINNFDTSHGVKFSTYAVPMIIGEVRRYLRDNNSIRVSRSLRDTAYKALSIRERMGREMQREPSISEIATEMGVPREDLVLALDAIQEPISLYEPVFHDDGDPIYVMDQVKDTKNSDVHWIENIALSEAMAKLSPRERHILELRFFEGKTQMEVAEEISISQAQVSRLEKNALKYMRKYV